ncbi:LysE family translocator [Kozakia baliensis]|uniref:LysE family translocator n=1 Tax=Kozakia baliensis TaxID=153496 RepID=UPI00345C2441
MSAHIWWLFAVTVFFLSGTPGPNMLHALSRSVNVGFRRSTSAMAGCASALFFALVLSAAGIGALLAAMPRLFDIVRYAGAAYLIWLGIKSWRASGKGHLDAPAAISGHTPWQLYRGGFLVGISNPKLLLFAAAFFPQFIDRQHPQLPQFVILVATFLCCEIFWLCLYGLGGRGLATFLTRENTKRVFDRVTGVFFMVFGVVLLRARV